MDIFVTHFKKNVLKAHKIHYRAFYLILFCVFLASCSSSGGYSGASTYGGGDEHGVTVYKTVFAKTRAVHAEANHHCKKYNKVATLVNCASIFDNSCVFSCDLIVESPLQEPKPQPKKKVPGKAQNLEREMIDNLKTQCADIGFVPGTEKFGDCVLKLIQ